MQAWSLRTGVPLRKAVDTHFLRPAMVRGGFQLLVCPTYRKQDVRFQI